MDTSDPDITFDQDGVCHHCREFAEKEVIRKAGLKNLPWIYSALRQAGKDKTYDCLLGLSGGVDSSLCLHYLIENGIRPFCFSVDNGWNTPESDENIMRLVETLKVPFFRYTIDLETFKELQRAFIQSGTANIEIPTDHILMATTYEIAAGQGIKYIISGGNLATEGIMPKAWGYNARDLKFIKAVYKKFYGKALKDLPLISIGKYLWYRFVVGIKVINLLDYYEYNRADAIKLLQEKYGWKDYGEKHGESRFTKWFQNYYLPGKFGFDKRRPHLSSMINSGQISRDEALVELSRPLRTLGSDALGIMHELCFFDGGKKTYKEYPNHEWLWNLLSKIYGHFKK